MSAHKVHVRRMPRGRLWHAECAWCDWARCARTHRVALDLGLEHAAMEIDFLYLAREFCDAAAKPPRLIDTILTKALGLQEWPVIPPPGGPQ